MPNPLRILLLSLLCLFSTARADSLRFASTAPGQAELAEALLTEAYRRLNLSVSTHYLPSSRALRESNSGAYDGELFRTELAGKGYDNLIQVPSELLNLEIVVVTNKNSGADETESFENWQFSVISGLVLLDSLIERYQIRKPIRVNSFEQQMELFLSEKVEAIFATPSMAEAVIQTHPDRNFRVIPADTSVRLYHYLHEKNADLVPLITQSINEMKASGEFERITQLYFEKREADLASKIEK